jgi:hypothetical protein
MILKILEYGKSFHLLVSSWCLCSMFYGFQRRGLSPPLLNLFLSIFWGYFGIAFLIYFSICLLLVYRKATEFCILILCPASLLKVFIGSKSFLVEFLWPLCIGSYHLKERIICLLPSLLNMSFISFSYLIVLARNSSTILNMRKESGHLCLISDFRENDFSFSSFSMILAIGLPYYSLYYVDICSFFISLNIWLKSSLSNMNIGTPACFWLLLAWRIFYHPFTFSLSQLVGCVSCRQKIAAFFFLIQWQTMSFLLTKISFTTAGTKYIQKCKLF